MSGGTDLAKLLAGMRPRLHPGTWVFATTDAPVDAAALGAVMTFREAEGTTLILPRDAARAAGLRHDFPCRMITLEVHSSLEAVGFIAEIAARLAGAGMGVNPVAGFFHDHLFVPEHRAGDAIALLEGMARDA